MTEIEQLTKRLAALDARVKELERLLAAKPNGNEQLLTTKELAPLLGYSVGTLENWRTAGVGGPPYCKGKGRRGSVRYRPSLVNKWLAKQNKTPIEV